MDVLDEQAAPKVLTQGAAPSKRGRRRPWIWGALIVLVGALVWVAWPRDSLLDRLATRIGLAREVHGNRQINRLSWLSDHELFEVDYALPMTPSSPLFRRYDIRTHASRPAQGLGDRLPKAADIWKVSPDGRWAVTATLWPDRFCHPAAVPVDGPETVQWPRVWANSGDMLGYGWMPDNRSFVMVFADKALLFRVDRPGQVNRIRIPTLPNGTSFIGTLRNGLLLLPPGGVRRHLNKKTPGQIALTVVDVSGPSPVVRPLTVQLPEGCTVHELSVAPTGDRIAWHLHFDDQPPASAFMQTLYRLIGRKPHVRGGLWVSMADGTDMREVGHFHDDDFELAPWPPGGSSVCFIRNDDLWSVPVAR